MNSIYDCIKEWKKLNMGEDKYLANVKNSYALTILKK